MRHRLDVTRRLHERMLEIIRTALPLIPASRDEADPGGLAHLRREMVVAMEDYCRHVHELRDAATRRDGPTIDALVEGCTALRSAYAAFRERWRHRDADANWYEYRLSAIVMMKQVRDHVRHAEQLRAARLPLAA